jgi:hypothetical protein
MFVYTRNTNVTELYLKRRIAITEWRVCADRFLPSAAVTWVASLISKLILTSPTPHKPVPPLQVEMSILFLLVWLNIYILELNCFTCFTQITRPSAKYSGEFRSTSFVNTEMLTVAQLWHKFYVILSVLYINLITLPVAVNKNCVRLCYYLERKIKFLPTFRENLPVPPTQGNEIRYWAFQNGSG